MKRYLLIILLTLIFFALAASVQAAEEKKTTIVPYLELPGAEDPTKGIPQYIRYIFIFSLGVVGIVAFIAMLVAAFQYVTSVGNPQKAAAAKDRIFSALLGMLLLFGSYLLLNTINPDLLKFKTEIAGRKLDFPDTTDTGGGTGCRYTSAFWDNFQINAGETATLTLERANCTDADKEDYKKHILPKLKQTSTGKTYLGTDQTCHRIADLAVEKKNDNEKWVLEYSFKYKCGDRDNTPYDKNIVCPGGYGGPILCNLLKNEPEILYIAKDEIKNTSPKQYISKKLTINVEDNLPEAWVCIIDVKSTPTQYTGCPGYEKYLYDSCIYEKGDCENYCKGKADEIGHDAKFEKCKKYGSEGLCAESIGCRNEL